MLAINADISKPLLVVPAEHADLFGPTFIAAANEQLDKLLKFAFSTEVQKRKVCTLVIIYA